MTSKINLIVAPTYNRNLPHLGLCSLRAYMKAHGYETRYLDFSALHYHDPMILPLLPHLSAQKAVRGMTLYTFLGPMLLALLQGDVEREFSPPVAMMFNYWVDAFAARAAEGSPDVIGFSIYESNFIFSLSIARAVRKSRPSLPIVFGGPYLMSPDICRILSEASDVVDYLVIGEGEEAFLGLASLLAGQSGTLPASCIRASDAAGVSRLTPAVVADPDALPPPDYSDIPLQAYRNNLLMDATFASCAAGAGEIALPILFGRGCPFRCSFCGHSPEHSPYRVKTVDRVMEEIRRLNREYGCRVFRVCDSLINMDRPWLEDFCDALTAEALPVYWYGHARAGGLDDDLARKMYKAGCRFLKFGIESGSDRMLKRMRKGMTAAEQEAGLRAAHDAGMKTRASFIYNFPGERREDLRETLDLISRNRSALDYFRPSETVLVPESDLMLRPGRYNIAMERFEDPDAGAHRQALSDLPVRWRSNEISENEMTSRRDWFVGEMAALSPAPRRQFDPPTFPELVSEALESGGRFIVPLVQQENWRKEARPGGNLHGVMTEAERHILEALEAGPMTLEQLASAMQGDLAATRSIVAYLISVGVVQVQKGA